MAAPSPSPPQARGDAKLEEFKKSVSSAVNKLADRLISVAEFCASLSSLGLDLRFEERKLADPGHRKRLAYAIARGLRDYFIEQPLEGTYYARKGNVSGAGVTAAGTGNIP